MVSLFVLRHGAHGLRPFLMTCSSASYACLQHGLVDELAEARHAMRLDVGLAHSLIEQFCHRNAILHDGAHHGGAR